MVGILCRYFVESGRETKNSVQAFRPLALLFAPFIVRKCESVIKIENSIEGGKSIQFKYAKNILGKEIRPKSRPFLLMFGA